MRKAAERLLRYIKDIEIWVVLGCFFIDGWEWLGILIVYLIVARDEGLYPFEKE